VLVQLHELLEHLEAPFMIARELHDRLQHKLAERALEQLPLSFCARCRKRFDAASQKRSRHSCGISVATAIPKHTVPPPARRSDCPSIPSAIINKSKSLSVGYQFAKPVEGLRLPRQFKRN
jgi:hypothetical protein